MSESKSTRRRRLEAYALSISIFAALLTVAGTTTFAVHRGSTASTAQSWITTVATKLGDLDYGWLTLSEEKGVVTVSGEAATASVRDDAYAAAKSEILAAAPTMVVVDNVGVRGGPTALGQALAALGPSPTTDDCQRAYDSTLESRPVAFEPRTAILSPASDSVLDAVSAVALKCQQWPLTIAARGEARSGPDLSLARAEAVRAYLAAHGVAMATVGVEAGGPNLPPGAVAVTVTPR